jgi:archaellum component FlaC
MEKSQFEVLMMAISGLRGEMNTRFDGMDKRFDALEGRVGNLEVRFDKLEGRVGGLEGRFDKLEGRVGKIEECLTVVVRDLKAVREQTAGTHEAVMDLRVRVARLEGPRA